MSYGNLIRNGAIVEVTGRERFVSDVAIAIFDKDTVDTAPVQTRNHFPAGAPRLFTDSIGIERVMVRGTTVLHQGRDTGARPGQFLERARDTYTVGIG
jgi:hypothetical protein